MGGWEEAKIQECPTATDGGTVFLPINKWVRDVIIRFNIYGFMIKLKTIYAIKVVIHAPAIHIDC